MLSFSHVGKPFVTMSRLSSKVKKFMVHSTGLKSSIGLVKIGRPDLKTRISDR